MTDAALIRIKALFTLGVAGVLMTLFTFGIVLRDQEVALLGSATRFVSALGYSAQYALGVGGGLAGAASAPAVSAEGEQGVARALPVLVYHGIVARSDRFSLTEAAFAEQLFALKRAGYQTVTTEEALAFLAGERELPDRSFLLTFDDGRRDSYERADPILDALGYTAVMFVATDASIDHPSDRTTYYLHPEELARMQGSGRWEIMSHARQVGGGSVALDGAGATGNFLSNRMWLPAEDRLETEAEYEARVEDELAGARSAIERLIPGTGFTFSYPFGDYGQQTENEPGAEAVIRAAVERSYDAAFKQVWQLDSEYTLNFPNDDRYAVRRIEVETDWSGKELVSFLAGAAAKPLPYEETFDVRSAWKSNWGTIEMNDTMLTLRAGNTSTGAFTFLDGTRDWTDYTFTTNVQRAEGTAVSLVARYAAEETMVLCTFNGRSVRLEQRIDGSATTVGQGTASGVNEATLGIRVSGASVACLENGEVVTEGRISGSLDRGGIGLRIWDEPIASATASMTSLRVVP
ncbi:MAG: polysaccharide deacetylase family protein [Patescibacteria group bacterium]